jgi:predicted HD superfamily hydrolase involved in NAD metabolism
MDASPQRPEPSAGRDVIPADDPDAGIVARLGQVVSAKRLLHCRRVSQLAESLALRWDLDAPAARRAGLLHDLCREARPEWRALAAAEGIVLPAWAGGNDVLLHGPLAAVLARREFRLAPQWCRAIAGHTTGRAGMTAEEQVLYVADHAAVGRKDPQVPYWRDLAHRDLAAATLELLSHRLQSLLAGGEPLWVPTVLARNDLLPPGRRR